MPNPTLPPGYRARYRRVGRRWWVTVDHRLIIVGSNVCLTLAGARRWARKVAERNATEAGPIVFSEPVDAPLTLTGRRPLRGGRTVD